VESGDFPPALLASATAPGFDEDDSFSDVEEANVAMLPLAMLTVRFG
jgi:hypothetical protein